MTRDFWDRAYNTDYYAYGEEPNQFVRECAPRLARGSTIASFAAGEGRNSVFLAQEGHHVTAYDQSEIGLKKAERLANNHGVSIQTEVKDLLKDPIPNHHFDAVINVYGHVHKDDQKDFLQKMVDCAKQKGEGIIILEVYSEEQLLYGTGGPSDVDYLYNPKTILDFFQDYYIAHFYYGEAERYEGDKHQGKCHIIQMMARL